MPLFMTQFSYTPEAWAALVKQPEDRSRVFAEYVEGFGGHLIGFYYAFSEYDGVIIFEAPDELTATAALMGVVSPGHDKAIRTTLLLTVDQAMEAMHRASQVRYRPPATVAQDGRPYHD